jgi:hypothetical protein
MEHWRSNGGAAALLRWIDRKRYGYRVFTVFLGKAEAVKVIVDVFRATQDIWLLGCLFVAGEGDAAGLAANGRAEGSEEGRMTMICGRRKGATCHITQYLIDCPVWRTLCLIDADLLVSDLKTPRLDTQGQSSTSSPACLLS